MANKTSSQNPGARRRSLAERGVDACCDLLARIHTGLARLLGGAFRRVWEIQSRLPLSLRFCIAALGLALLALAARRVLTVDFYTWLDLAPDQMRLLELAGEAPSGRRLALWALVAGAMALVAAGTAWWRHRAALWILKSAWSAAALLWVAMLRWALTVPAVLHQADYRAFDKLARNDIWTGTFFAAAAVAPWLLLMLAALLMTGTRRWYGDNRKTIALGFGDRVIDNFRTGGNDWRLRSSVYWAVALCLATLVAPFMIRGCGSEEYGMVKGSGEMQVQVVRMKRPQQRQKQRKLTVNPFSPYILERMNIDDVKTLADLEETTRDTYQADQASGKMGQGGGKGGGWPKGMEGANVRFIRLKYAGGDWDQDMGRGADFNLLIRFNQFTGLPIARETEFREIERLARFPQKRSPPFVFLTGRGNLNISTREAKIIREYCENEGGMLFIDNGGGHFGRSVRQALSKIFPGKRLVDIANDDPIYQAPFVFPDGAPPFWHHDGNRALGIRHEGRWIVFYHPGDINDAWKDGHSGASSQVADQAYKLGVNVIYYAFNQYYRRHYSQD